MKKSTKRLLGGLAFAAGAVGAATTFVKKKGNSMKPGRAKEASGNVWARPGMEVTFRAELMPGRDREQRTARVKQVLPSGRVLLFEIEGEHAEKEFDPQR
ncbi:MAG TPA: hypothetical protein VLL54_19650 [Pyrinomonadaceae bacterium]|nr:hypothetical protein [Pyrinomonadaceae bacterium]